MGNAVNGRVPVWMLTLIGGAIIAIFGWIMMEIIFILQSLATITATEVWIVATLNKLVTTPLH